MTQAIVWVNFKLHEDGPVFHGEFDPAARAASCNAASSMTTGSGPTANRRNRPSPFLPPAEKTIFNPRRLHLTGVPSGSFRFIGLM